MSVEKRKKSDVEQVAWAIRFAEMDLTHLREGDRVNLQEDLLEFLNPGAADLKAETEGAYIPPPTMAQAKKVQSVLKDALRKLVLDLKSEREIAVFPGWTRLKGSFCFVSHASEPFTGSYQLDGDEALTLMNLAQNLIESGIRGDQIRRCPECERTFLVRRKPRRDVTLHCSLRCSRNAATRRYRQKNGENIKVNERERSHRRYAKKQQRKHGSRVKIARRPRKGIT